MQFLARRFAYMVIVLLLVSVVSFIIIELPPGDYLTFYVMQLESRGERVDEAQLASLQMQYGLDLPVTARYLKWMGNLLRGNLGQSFLWNRPVTELLAERLPLTILISFVSFIVVYVIAIPVGIYSATHQYSPADYLFTVVGFTGMAIPNFLLALILMFLFYKYFDIGVTGLFSSKYLTEGWSMAKFLDLLKHLPVPVIVVGTAGTASLIRVMRGTLLDELRKQYVVTARAKGMKESALLFRYPVRVAINPIVSTMGWMLPAIVSGETITAIVLSLPTVGPLLLQALLSQDMYLAGSTVMLLTGLTVIGTFVSDLLLAVVDPRIRYERRT